jgi:hypothetical protein
MSWGTCTSGSNNIHFDFPPIMSDGRNFASWQPGAVLSENIRKEENIKSNWDYRTYLTQNADQIIKYNQLEACDQCCACPAKYGDNQPVSNSPFLYKSTIENTRPFGYENSDLKNMYLSSFDLQSRMVIPVFSQTQILQAGDRRSN